MSNRGDNINPFNVPFDTVSKKVNSFCNMMGIKYLNALDSDSKEDWEKLVIELRTLLEDPALEAAFPNIDTSILYSDKTLNPKDKKANHLYRIISGKGMPSPIVKEEKENRFVVPNKPMYRIFEIDDMKEINGFTGEYIVQEKYDGLRVQLHKFKNKVTIYSFNGNDITDKMGKAVKILEKKEFPNCILDGEAILYKGKEPLVRADTIAHINKKGVKENDAEIKIHVFDIMYFENESVVTKKLEERMGLLMQNFSAQSDEYLVFPNKSNTREADSLSEIEEYAKEIMDNPTSEGVVIKDSKSSYVIGKKKNPKWIKWKKFVDLDVVVLDSKENKDGTFNYNVGIGPVEEDTPKSIQVDDDYYMAVGKTTNTKISAENGDIIRVKVDEVQGNNKKGFSLFNAKVVEKPETTQPDKLVTLEFLTKDGKKSLADYSIEALTKSYVITDGIHGTAILKGEIDLEGFTFYGFADNNLMSKNAEADMDIWKKELRIAYGKDNGRFFTFIQQVLRDGPANAEVLAKKVKEHDEALASRLFGSKLVQGVTNRLREGGETYGIVFEKRGKKFSYDDKVINKAENKPKGKFEIWVCKDKTLNFVIKHKEGEMSWHIDVKDEDEMYDLLGEAGKYPATVDAKPDKEKLLERGSLTFGANRNGYHEYILSGPETKGKMHFRVLPVDGKKMWLAWTGYETKPAPESSDEGLIDINKDKYAKLGV